MYNFAAFLFNPPKRNPVQNAFGAETDLFFKFNLSAGQQIFSRSRLALWNRPYAVVFMGEEWSAGVREQNFELIVPAPEHEQTSADTTSFGFRLFPHLVILCGNLISAFC